MGAGNRSLAPYLGSPFRSFIKTGSLQANGGSAKSGDSGSVVPTLPDKAPQNQSVSANVFVPKYNVAGQLNDKTKTNQTVPPVLVNAAGGKTLLGT